MKYNVHQIGLIQATGPPDYTALYDPKYTTLYCTLVYNTLHYP